MITAGITSIGKISACIVFQPLNCFVEVRCLFVPSASQSLVRRNAGKGEINLLTDQNQKPQKSEQFHFYVEIPLFPSDNTSKLKYHTRQNILIYRGASSVYWATGVVSAGCGCGCGFGGRGRNSGAKRKTQERGRKGMFGFDHHLPPSVPPPKFILRHRFSTNQPKVELVMEHLPRNSWRGKKSFIQSRWRG